MHRKEFLTKSLGLLALGILSMTGMAAQPTEKDKKYKVIDKRCDGCGHCFRACKDNALVTNKEGKAVIDQQKCKGCGDCTRFCRRMAIVEQELKNQ